MEEVLNLFSNTLIESGKSNGFNYLIVDNPFGFCAYVCVPENNKIYGKHYDDIDMPCNGGLTYSRKCGNFWVIGWDYVHIQNFVKEPTMLEINEDILAVTEKLLNYTLA